MHLFAQRNECACAHVSMCVCVCFRPSVCGKIKEKKKIRKTSCSSEYFRIKLLYSGCKGFSKRKPKKCVVTSISLFHWKLLGARITTANSSSLSPGLIAGVYEQASTVKQNLGDSFRTTKASQDLFYIIVKYF